MKATNVIAPPATLGLLGGGQLGRMFIQAAHRLGYRVHLYASETDSPAGQIADEVWIGDYRDEQRVQSFARTVKAVTFEFENVPAAAAEAAGQHAHVRPSGAVLHVAQNRIREKQTLERAGLPVTPFAAIRSREDLEDAMRRLGPSAVLKTADSGYDGKGQIRISQASELDRAWQQLGTNELVLEKAIDFECEISVVAARTAEGEIACYSPFENQHRHHILDVSISPASICERTSDDALAITREVMAKLDVVGVLCVEYFVTSGGGLLINEIAPRPHNSGHLTIDACVTSQFEQQVRAICGLPLGATRQHRPAAMANLLGDLWHDGQPAWERALGHPEVKLHLYGKAHARPGRKMGHLTALADSTSDAAALVRSARESLCEARQDRPRNTRFEDDAIARTRPGDDENRA